MKAATQIEQMDEAAILDIDRRGDIPNCSVTSYRTLGDDDGNDQLPHVLNLVKFPAPLLEDGTPVTFEPDAARRCCQPRLRCPLAPPSGPLPLRKASRPAWRC